VRDEEARNWGLPFIIVVKVPPMMNTVLTPWNILVVEAVGGGCVSVVDWLVDCRRRVMNVSSLCRNSIFVGNTWLLEDIYIDP